jgi:hypothetical protein
MHVSIYYILFIADMNVYCAYTIEHNVFEAIKCVLDWTVDSQKSKLNTGSPLSQERYGYKDKCYRRGLGLSS